MKKNINSAANFLEEYKKRFGLASASTSGEIILLLIKLRPGCDDHLRHLGFTEAARVGVPKAEAFIGKNRNLFIYQRDSQGYAYVFFPALEESIDESSDFIIDYLGRDIFANKRAFGDPSDMEYIWDWICRSSIVDIALDNGIAIDELANELIRRLTGAEAREFSRDLKRMYNIPLSEEEDESEGGDAHKTAWQFVTEYMSSFSDNNSFPDESCLDLVFVFKHEYVKELLDLGFCLSDLPIEGPSEADSCVLYDFEKFPFSLDMRGHVCISFRCLADKAKECEEFVLSYFNRDQLLYVKTFDVD